MKTKFKVGDLVKVREDLKDERLYCMDRDCEIYDRFIESTMGEFRGKSLEVIGIEYNKYRLKGSEYLWTDGMLEKYPVKIAQPLEKTEVKPLKTISVSEIDKEIQAHLKKIQELENLKKERFNDKTLILRIHKKNTNSEVFLYDEDIKEDMFKKEYYTIIKVYRHKNTLEVKLLQTGGFRGVGVSTCHSDDDFNYLTGLNLAISRAYADLYKNKVKWIEGWA